MTYEEVILWTRYGLVIPLALNKNVPMDRWCWSKYKKCRPTDDTAVIRCWFDCFPDCNWGLIPMKCIVLDIDAKDGKSGLASALAAGGLTPTMIVRTPSGGFHYYYAFDDLVPFITRNGFLGMSSGIDIRYGKGGFVAMPGSKKPNGIYQVMVGQESLAGGLLTPVPAWVITRIHVILEERRIKAEKKAKSKATRDAKRKLKNKELKAKTRVQRSTKERTKELVYVLKCNSDEPLSPLEQKLLQIESGWKTIRDKVRFMFLKKQDNRRIWNHVALDTMVKDRSQSAFEFQLAVRLCHVGASDKEIKIAYRYWCSKHRLKRKTRFATDILGDARILSDPYVAQWEKDHPPGVPHGTTTTKILDAIEAGSSSRKAIVSATSIRTSTVGAQLSRLVKAGRLRNSGGVYALPLPHPATQDASAIAA
jgi:hypothetical protein